MFAILARTFNFNAVVVKMVLIRVLALALIVVGVAALAYGGFTYSQEETVVKVGSLELRTQEEKQFTVPMWASIGAIAAGVVLLLAGGRKS